MSGGNKLELAIQIISLSVCAWQSRKLGYFIGHFQGRNLSFKVFRKLFTKST